MESSTSSAVKLQLEKEIDQLVQNNPTPKFLGSPIDSELRSTLQSWASQRKVLAEKRECLELILEEERIQKVLRELEELHPQTKHECVICLEEITDANRCILVCCGQGTCRVCAEDNVTRDQSIKIKCCPLCRHPNFGGGGKERFNNVLKFAENGEAWAQTMMGDIYMNLDENVGQTKVNKVKARKWYGMADEQDFPEAIYKHAHLFDEKEKNPSRYYQRLKKAALFGQSSAAQLLAIHYWMKGVSCSNKVEYYASISLQSVSNANKQEYLSTIFGMILQMKPRKSVSDLYRVKYYLEIGAKKNFDSLPLLPEFRSTMCSIYANVMLQLGMHEYCGYTYEIPGYSFLPKVRYWENEGGGEKKAMKLVAGPDDYGRGGRSETHCANCNVEASRGMKFKHCVRCKAAWYCSKDCQTEAWKAGHKFDCKQRF